MFELALVNAHHLEACLVGRVGTERRLRPEESHEILHFEDH
jgi:hypothetical protein